MTPADGGDADGRPFADAASGSVFGNSFRNTEPRIGSTGFRPHAMRHDASRWAPGPRPAEEFLVNSRLCRADREFEASAGAYFTEPSAMMVALAGLEGRQGTRAVALPEPIPLRMSIDEAVRRRRSGRSYTGDAVPIRYLATMLRGGGGVTAPPEPGAIAPAFRATASAGGLYPVAIHVVALRVDGLDRGTYVYDPRGERLWETGGPAAAGAVVAAMAAPDETIMTSNAGALLLLVARPWRSMRKYGDRGMRHVFIEAGMIAQSVSLAAAALGLGSVDCASLYDDEVHEAIDVDGVYEALVHSVVVGIPA